MSLRYLRVAIGFDIYLDSVGCMFGGCVFVCFVVYVQYFFEIISLYIYNISTYMHAHIILCSFCVGLHGNSIHVVFQTTIRCVFLLYREGCLGMARCHEKVGGLHA